MSARQDIARIPRADAQPAKMMIGPSPCRVGMPARAGAALVVMLPMAFDSYTFGISRLGTTGTRVGALARPSGYSLRPHACARAP